MARTTHFSGDEFDAEAHPAPGPWIALSSSRVSQARYDRGMGQVQCIFRDGTPWVYDGVPEATWRGFVTSSSPGRYINDVLNSFAYWHGAFDTTDGDEANG